MSTETVVYTGTGRRDGSCHPIAPSVRVRKEAFGLLFYNTEESRMTFVKSGDLLRISNLPNGEKAIMTSGNPENRVKASRLLAHLSDKGLIRES